MIGDIGFPKIVLSYSTSIVGNQVTVPSICRPLPVGFAMSGVLSFLGLQLLHVDIRINEEVFMVQTAMRPINIIGLIELYKSSSDSTRGPALTVEIRNNRISGPHFKVSISGYLRLIKVISTGAQFSITDKEMATNVKVDLFLFRVSLKLYCPYTALLFRTSSYRVAVSLEIDALRWIGRAIETIVRKAADIAGSIIGGLQRAFDSAKAALEKAGQWLTDKQQDLDIAKNKLSGPHNTLNAAQSKVNGLCSIRSCNTCKKLPSSVTGPEIYLAKA